MHRLLICSFLLFLSSLYFFVLGDSCRLPLARKIGCKSQVYSSYKLLLVRKLKKRGGNGAELVGGDYMHCHTVQCYPIEWGIKMCSCIFVIFFLYIVRLKKARSKYVPWCITIIILIKFFWFDLIWPLKKGKFCEIIHLK